MIEEKQERRKESSFEKIQKQALYLFNELGEGNVSVAGLTQSMRMSPGRLYYHFRNKDDIIDSIFMQFEKKFCCLADGFRQDKVSVADVCSRLRDLFKLIWEFRFLYRDACNIVSRNRTVEIRMEKLIAQKIDSMMVLFSKLRDCENLTICDNEMRVVSTNIILVAMFWLPFRQATYPHTQCPVSTIEEYLVRGCEAALEILRPYLNRPCDRC